MSQLIKMLRSRSEALEEVRLEQSLNAGSEAAKLN